MTDSSYLTIHPGVHKLVEYSALPLPSLSHDNIIISGIVFTNSLLELGLRLGLERRLGLGLESGLGVWVRADESADANWWIA